MAPTAGICNIPAKQQDKLKHVGANPRSVQKGMGMGHSYEARIRRVLDYIFDNPAGDHSLDRMADVAAMSRFHWHRVFHAMTGETCAQASRRIRLHRAACWLVQSDRPVATIARDAGYGSVQSFTRAFGDAYGQAPAEFRRHGRIAPAPVFTREGHKTMYDVEIENHPDRRLLALPHKGSYMNIGKAFENLAAAITARGRWPDVRASVGVYYDDPTAVAEEDLRSHAGVVVDANTAGEDGLEDVTLAGGRFAVLHYKGPYAGIPKAYPYLYGEWLASSGEEPRDAPSFEVYLNNPMDTAPEDLLTDICMPIK